VQSRRREGERGQGVEKKIQKYTFESVISAFVSSWQKLENRLFGAYSSSKYLNGYGIQNCFQEFTQKAISQPDQNYRTKPGVKRNTHYCPVPYERIDL
jgi:hypothetical protein